MVFPVVMYGCESWTIKNAEHWRIDAFELWCWKRLLRVPWTSGRSNQSILKEINSERSLEGLMFRLKLQYFGHLMWRADSLEKTLMLEKIEGKRGKEAVANKMVRQHHWLNRHGFEQTLGDNKGQGSLVCCSPQKSQTRLGNWKTTTISPYGMIKKKIMSSLIWLAHFDYHLRDTGGLLVRMRRYTVLRVSLHESWLPDSWVE